MAVPAAAEEAPPAASAAGELRFDDPDGWLPARLVRGAGAVVRADGADRRCHEPDLRAVL